MFHLRRYLLFSVFILTTIAARAQNKPIGSWSSYLPYKSAIGLATDGKKLYTICPQAFYTYDPSTQQLEPFSKVEGMSDIGMQCGAYDYPTSTMVLVYADGNVDLLKDNTFYNVPDLKIKNVAGAKTVFQVYTLNGKAYLASALGVMVIDLAKQETIETYQFTSGTQIVPVKAFTSLGDSFYALTTDGIYSVNKANKAIQNTQEWSKINNTGTLTSMCTANGFIYLSSDSLVFKLTNDTLQVVYVSSRHITHIDPGASSLLISEYSSVPYMPVIKLMDGANNITDSFRASGLSTQAVQTNDGSIWYADEFNGLFKRISQDNVSGYRPEGPVDYNSFDMYAHNGDLYVAHGGYNPELTYQGNRNGVSYMHDGKWTYFKEDYYPPFNGLRDFDAVIKDEVTGTRYFGSFWDGLFILNKDGSYEWLKENSIFDSSKSYYNIARDVTSLALGKDHTLWVGLAWAQHSLYARSPEGKWYSFIVPGVEEGGPITIDDNGQIWQVNTLHGGITVYDAGQLDDPTDDKAYRLTTGAGYGNLPDNNVLCVVKDKSNNMWIGTASGIGIVSHCNSPFTQTPPCDAERPIVQYDQFAGYLFDGNSVKTIAVDGANRKWVGTNDGVWLLSAHAEEIIYRFTTDNSPLPSNGIQKIAIDDESGDVYIGTDMGLVSFRSTATEGGTKNDNVTTFPNPVPSGYSGTIAIKGLAANSDVRITDVSGQLVYHTKALGGQAVWSGLDYKGHRPQSGVYLIFASNSDGTETYTGKMVFLK